MKQAETQKDLADGAVTARLPEAYQWLLVPVQASPQGAMEWQVARLNGQDALAVRASKKLRSDELLVTEFAASRLRMDLDRVPLWRGNHVAIKQLVEDFARYLYLPKLRDPEVLLHAIREGVALQTWEQDAFAYADGFDEAAGRYRGLRGSERVSILDSDAPGLLVKPVAARQQLTAEEVSKPEGVGQEKPGTRPTPLPIPGREPERLVPKRFHGTVVLDPTRAGRDASRIADEVIAHLAGLEGTKVKVTLEIEADIADGAPEHVVRTVTENCRTLKFMSQGFETE